MPLKSHDALKKMHIIIIEAQSPHVGRAWKFGLGVLSSDVVLLTITLSTCINCGGGDRGRVAIYRPFGEFRRAKSYCHLYGAQGQRQAYLLPMPRWISLPYICKQEEIDWTSDRENDYHRNTIKKHEAIGDGPHCFEHWSNYKNGTGSGLS
ncbi:hypothetical protein TNCV_3773651 [Trichonephila clavipes]|nr:hypothetical protein TNCV_3773651 [Trichonephila clavipes]